MSHHTVDRMPAALNNPDELVQALAELGWEGVERVPLHDITLPENAVSIEQVAHQRPTVVAHSVLRGVSEEAIVQHTRWLKRLTPMRSVLVFCADSEQQRLGVGVSAHLEDDARAQVLPATGLDVHSRECLDAIVNGSTALDAACAASGVLARKDVNQRFFAAITRAAQRLDEGWSTAAVAQKDRLDTGTRRRLTIQLLCRLLFLYFIARKRWLGDTIDWLPRYLLGGSANADIWNDRLSPLFFRGMNKPPIARDEDARVRFDSVPYLNGGLFERTDTEKELSLTLPAEPVRALVCEVLERFRLVSENGGEDRAAVDPEMLGTVFERLMNVDQRKSTGAFYTPPSRARSLVREALTERVRSRILDAIEESRREIGWASESAPDTHACAVSAGLSVLADTTVLDPACGSGTFLTATLAELSETAIDSLRAAGVAINRGLRRRIRRTIVTRSLYGVDRSHTAIRVTELRLWLALASDLPDGPDFVPPPLPNLGHHIVCGDFLVAQPDLLDASLKSGRGDSDDRLADLSARYAESTGAERYELRDALVREGEERLLRAVDDRLSACRAEAREEQLTLMHPDEHPLAEPEDDERIARLEELRRRLVDGAYAQTFNPAVHLADAMARGGFSYIVGNPPWVRWSAIVPDERRRLRRDYRVLAAGGGRTRLHASQPDLCAAFVERGASLLRGDGRMAYLLSAKLLRADSAGPFRQFVRDHAHVVLIDDFSARQEKVFTASTYTVGLVLDRRGGHDENAERRVTLRGTHEEQLTEEQFAEHVRRCRGRWVTDTVREAADHGLNCGAVRVGDVHRIRYGVKTGLNAAFVVDEPIVGCTVPVVRGADIRDGAWSASGHLVFTHDRETGDPLCELSPECAASLAPWQEKLEQRSDLRASDPWWRLFRVRGEALGHRVAWPDIALNLDPVWLPPVVEGGPVALNTVYSFAVADREEATRWIEWLNEPRIQREAELMADMALNGYHRFRAAVVAGLPAPAFTEGVSAVPLLGVSQRR